MNTATMMPANDISTRFPEPKKVLVLEIRDRDHKRFGRVIPGDVAKGQHAEIIVGRRIRLFGVERGSGRLYRRDFRIGDVAEVGSYNLTYTGTITAIGEKTITVVEDLGTPGAKTHRMSLHEFNWRNWNFDAEECARRNFETMETI